MKKMLGVMTVLFTLCFVMPAKAQSAAGAVIKTTTKEAREKIKAVTQAKTAAKKNAETAKKGSATTRRWGATTAAASTDKGGNKGQVIIPVKPVPVVDANKRYVPVDTSQFNPW